MVFIDALNVIHAAGNVEPLLGGLDLKGLCALIEQSRFGSGPVLLVCDGTGGGAASGLPGRGSRRLSVSEEYIRADGPIRVVYAGPGQDADSAIERMLDEREHAGHAKEVLVVSNDRRVQQAAVGIRARRLSSDEFLALIVSDARSRASRESKAKGGRTGEAASEALSPEATAYWMKELGVRTEKSDLLTVQPVNRAPASRKRRQPGRRSPAGQMTPSSGEATSIQPIWTWPSGSRMKRVTSQKIEHSSSKCADAKVHERLCEHIARVALLGMAATFMSLTGCARPSVATQGSKGQVTAEYRVGELTAKVGPEVGVLAVKAAAEQTFRARGYIITKSSGTKDRASVSATGTGEGRNETTTIQAWLVPNGTKVQIEPGLFGDETAARAMLDELLARLGR